MPMHDIPVTGAPSGRTIAARPAGSRAQTGESGRLRAYVDDVQSDDRALLVGTTDLQDAASDAAG